MGKFKTHITEKKQPIVYVLHDKDIEEIDFPSAITKIMLKKVAEPDKGAKSRLKDQIEKRLLAGDIIYSSPYTYYSIDKSKLGKNFKPTSKDVVRNVFDK